MKKTYLSTLCIGLLSATLAMGAEFQKLGDAAIEAAAANPRQLITALNGAETSDITDVAVRVNRNIENSQFPETIVDRLVVATAIAVAKAGEDAPEVAVALLKETKKHHAIIAATAAPPPGIQLTAVLARLTIVPTASVTESAGSTCRYFSFSMVIKLRSMTCWRSRIV